MAKKKSTHHIESEGVVSQGLVDGFTRARDNEVVTLLFEFENLNITLPNGLNILQGVSGAIRPVCSDPFCHSFHSSTRFLSHLLFISLISCNAGPRNSYHGPEWSRENDVHELPYGEGAAHGRQPAHQSQGFGDPHAAQSHWICSSGIRSEVREGSVKRCARISTANIEL